MAKPTAATRRPRRASEPRASKPPAPRQRSFPQARARATYDKLIEAAKEVFSRRGFDEAQTPEIAQKAGVATGSFYRYFRDKRQVFVEMIGHHLAAMHAEMSSRLAPDRFAGRDTREVVDSALEALFDQVRKHPRLYRLMQEMSLRDADVARLHARYDALGVDLIEGVIGFLAPRDAIPDARAAAQVIVIAAEEVTLARAGLRTASSKNLDGEALRVALREMIHRFVFPGSAGGSQRR